MGCALSTPVMAMDTQAMEVEKQLQDAQDKEQYQFKAREEDADDRAPVSQLGGLT